MKKSNLKWIVCLIICLIMLFIVWYFFLCDVEFTINKSNIEMQIGTKEKIDYNLAHSLKKVTWSSSDDGIASVSNDGVITSNNYGLALITGTIQTKDKVISDDVLVNIYGGEKGVSLESVNVKGDFSIAVRDEIAIPMEFTPANGYIEAITYKMNKEGIVSIKNNKLVGLSEGIVDIEITINNLITKRMRVRVMDGITNRKNIDDFSFKDEVITLDLGEKKIIDYDITPEDAYIYDVKWEVEDSKVIDLDNGVVSAKDYGSTSVKLTINGDITKSIDVIVGKPSSGINVYSSSKIITKVGIIDHVVASVIPSDAIQKLRYSSSDSNILDISNTGEIIAKSPGTGTIKLETEDRKNTKEIPFIVHPNIGVVSGDGGIWGYQSDVSYVPVRADATFFNNLVSQGIGSLNGDIYTYSNYSYNIRKSEFSYDGKSGLMRLYYPPNVDLSELNTFTFLGGAGERVFGGFFASIEQKKEILTSKGVLILMAARNGEGFNSNVVVACTNFVKEIIKQNDKAFNSIGGYSLGGPKAGEAAEKGDYKRLMIFDSYFDNVATNVKLKDKEIIFYSPTGDSMAEKTKNNLTKLKNNGTYKNVIIVSNSKDIINKYQNDFLIINPGTDMGSGHGNNIIVKANYFMFGCD